MASRYEARFAELKSQNRKAFIPFTLLGWPSKEHSLQLTEHMIKSGVSALELGIAFSDPIADGPIIQSAATETLSSGFTVASAFDLLKDIRKLDANIPIGLLVYFNVVLAYGLDAFYKQAKKLGIDGVLVADLPIENVYEISAQAKESEIDPIFLVSPLTTPERIELILEQAGGFIYLISRLGVTGIQKRDDKKDKGLKQLIEKISKHSDVPICAGFGISTPQDAQHMFELGADGVISGSKVIQIARSNLDTNNFQSLADYYREMLAVANCAPVST